jgi:hypothetical protein
VIVVFKNLKIWVKKSLGHQQDQIPTQQWVKPENSNGGVFSVPLH